MESPAVQTPVRKRVSQACQTCAAKKVKCDGLNNGPGGRCGPCSLRNEPECIYGVSKRRRSNFYTQSGAFVPQASPANATFNTFQSNGHGAPPNYAEQRPAGPSFSISPETSKRLFRAYFESIHPMWPLLYKPLYTSLDYTYPSPNIPEPLVLAIFSIGSCVDGARFPKRKAENGVSIEKFPEPKDFFEEAFNLLQLGTGRDTSRRPINALNPSILNCQVLVILALQQHGVAEYARAAILVSLASAMAIELQLHRVYEPNEPVEREIRSRLWWNLFILEKMIAGEQGRPFILRAEESDCPWPSTSESDEFELMSVPAIDQAHSEQIRGSTSVKLRTISALHTTISLSVIIEDVYRLIYGLRARKAIRENTAAGDRVRLDLWKRLLEWEQELPPNLRLDLEGNSVPGVITNVVIMLTEIIMCNRPFILRWIPGRPDESPFQICLQAANRMCTILEKYLERSTWWPCDMVFSIFVCASVLLHHSKQAKDEEGTETRARLRLCIHWLSVLGRSWKTAGARQQLLTDLYDLPQALQDPVPKILASHTGPGMNSSHRISKQPALVGNMTPLSQPTTGANLGEDWAFLQDFGDSSDQFYDWDSELRNLLNSNTVNELTGFSFS